MRPTFWRPSSEGSRAIRNPVPMPTRSRQRAGGGAVVELLKVLLKAVAEQERVAPKVSPPSTTSRR